GCRREQPTAGSTFVRRALDRVEQRGGLRPEGAVREQLQPAHLAPSDGLRRERATAASALLDRVVQTVRTDARVDADRQAARLGKPDVDGMRAVRRVEREGAGIMHADDAESEQLAGVGAYRARDRLRLRRGDEVLDHAARVL